MASAKLVLLRHGQTDYNKNKLMTGQCDVPLNETGIEEAKEAGRQLRDIAFDKVFSSHLSRAFNTAVLAVAHSSPANDHIDHIEQRREIAEVDVGIFESRNYTTDPEIVNWVRKYDIPLPGGESDRQAVERVTAFFEAELLPRLERGENVLVVAHAGIVRAFDFVMELEDVPEDGIWSKSRAKHVKNASPVVFEFEEGALVRYYNIDSPDDAMTAANNNTPKRPKPGR